MASKTKPHASENATAQEIQVGPIPPPADTSNQFNMEPITEDTTRKLSARKENITLVLITLTQLVQMIPLGVGINSGLAIGRALGANDIQSTWIVASYPLTQGTFVLIGGRLGAIYGHKDILTLGCLWWVFWALCGGFSRDLIFLCIMRGLCGIGGGLMVPNIVALIGISFPLGRKRNLGIALFGAMAPVGAVGGSLVGAVIIQLSDWRWIFLWLGLFGAVVYGAVIIFVDADTPLDPNGSIDFVGAYLGVAGLILFNFVWNQAPAVGWQNTYEITLLIVAIAHLTAFAYWESNMAKDPILPFTIWKAPSFGLLMLATLFSFMGLGIFFWYMNMFMQNIRGDSLIKVAVQYQPLTIAGFFCAFLAGWMIPRLPAQVIIGIGCTAMVVVNVLLATIRADMTYWAMAFPAMFISAFTIDIITASAQIIASNAVPRKHQGVAGSLIGTLLSYGMATGLGFAGTVEVNTFRDGTDLLRGYHSAAYLAVGLSAAALVICCFVRIPKDTREGWGEEDSPNGEPAL